jgi:hypothetical protein
MNTYSKSGFEEILPAAIAWRATRLAPLLDQSANPVPFLRAVSSSASTSSRSRFITVENEQKVPGKNVFKFGFEPSPGSLGKCPASVVLGQVFNRRLWNYCRERISSTLLLA